MYKHIRNRSETHRLCADVDRLLAVQGLKMPGLASIGPHFPAFYDDDHCYWHSIALPAENCWAIGEGERVKKSELYHRTRQYT